MALVLNYTPPAYSSVHGDLIYTVYESVKANDPATYPDYKYVADVYIGSTLIARLKAFPQPDNKRGIFNIGPIVRNYLATQFNPLTGILAQQLGSGAFYTDVQVKMGEEYGFTTYTNLLTDSVRRFYNSYEGQIISQPGLLANYSGLMASNRPYVGDGFNPHKVTLPQPNYFIPFFSEAASVGIEVYGFTALGASTGNYTATLTVTSGSMQILNLSPYAINQAKGSTIIGATTAYYDILLNGGDTTLRFTVEDERVYKPYMVHFLNQLGGFESMLFNKVSRKTYEVERKTFNQLPYRVDGSGGVTYRTGTVLYDTKTTYATKFKQRMKLTTDLLTDAEWKWLKELVFSPVVYVEINGDIFPVTVGANNYEEKNWLSDKLQPLTIDVDFGVTNNTQFR